MTDQSQEEKLFGDLEDDELNDAFGELVQFEASPDKDAETARKTAEKALGAKTRDKIRKLDQVA